jgi:hypothetical protein
LNIWSKHSSITRSLPCSFGLSATRQHYFFLWTNQQPASSIFLSEQISTIHRPNEQTAWFITSPSRKSIIIQIKHQTSINLHPWLHHPCSNLQYAHLPIYANKHHAHLRLFLIDLHKNTGAIAHWIMALL